MSLNVNNNVGYTVVDGGNIHIENGVASGFSGSDYLHITSGFSISSDTKLEIGFKLSDVVASSKNSDILRCLGTGVNLRFYVTTVGKVAGSYKEADGNTKYISFSESHLNEYFKFTREGNDIKLLSSSDNQNWTTLVESDNGLSNMTITSVIFGGGEDTTTFGPLKGSIDLNNTYIKINGVTWFNGKQKASTTVNEIYLNRNVGYTVVGSPTIVDGVVSGFSNNDYLQIQNAATTLSNSSTFEIITKFKMSSMKGWQIISKMWTTPTNFEGGLSTQNGKVKWYIYNNIVSTSMTCDTVLSKDVWYYAKQTKINNVYSVSWSNDGITWYDTKEIELADAGFFNTFLYGNNQGYGNENLFIDLNETYIKVNGITWFSGKEQASPTVNEVYLNRNVGYDIVGNPTINNGIVSGFSADDYLTLPQPDLSGPFEMFFKFTTPSTWGTSYDIVFSTSGVSFQKQGPNRYLAYYLVGTGESSYTQYNGSHTLLQENTTYYVKIVYDEAAITAYISTDGNTWETDMTVNYASGFTSSICVFGKNRNLGQQFWNGSIDLNETYIKVNGVTWFNGKQTATTPVWTRSV